MPAVTRIQKQAIINTAMQIARKEGIDGVNVRAIAKKLNCSVQPIYYQFKNMEELKIELYKEMQKYFYKFLTRNINKEIPSYKQTGINYIKFAKEEPNLFSILFMSKSNLPIEEFVSSYNGNYEEYSNIVKESTNLDDKDIKEFHIKMWIFTHGLAALTAKGTCDFNDEQISSLLTSEFKALMLAENEKK